MHEMALCESVRKIIEDESQQRSFTRVVSVHLEIGALAGVEPEAMEFCFDAVMNKSIADGARLRVDRVPGLAWCMVCAQNVPINQRFDACGQCGSYQLQVVGGDQMLIKELEVQ